MLVRGASNADTMSQYLIDRLDATDNIEVRFQTQVAEAKGRDRLEALVLTNGATGTTSEAPARSLFILIGAVPPTDWLQGQVALDAQGFVLTGQDLLADSKLPRAWPLDRQPFLLETSLPGVFAAGDVRAGSGKHVATAVGEGSTAVMSTWQYLEEVGV